MQIVTYISKDLVEADKRFLEFLNDGERLLLLALEQGNKKASDIHRTNIK